ncbi:MAG: hypothetical protein U0930_21940 [Pirellulales bacterium]
MRFSIFAFLILIAGCTEHRQQRLQNNLSLDSVSNTSDAKFVESEIQELGTSRITVDTQFVAFDPLDISQRLKRLQSSFDQQDVGLPLNESDECIIQRIVFAARVIEVRQLKQDDTVVSTFDRTNSLVAELDITQTVDNRHSAIRSAGKIVVPTCRSEEIWRHMHKEGHEYIFEYFKLGNRETVWKFGC